MAPLAGKITASLPSEDNDAAEPSKSKAASMGIALASYKPPVVGSTERPHKAGIAPFGLDNRYPYHSLDQFRNSPTHGAICRATAKLYAGLGFTFAYDGKTEDQTTAWTKQLGQGRSINRMGKQWALDLKIHNGFAIEVLWARDGKSIARLKYVDFSHVRKNLDANETLVDYRLCKRWTSSTTITTKGVIAMQPFDPSKVTRKQVNADKTVPVDADGNFLDAIDPATGLPIIDQASQLYYYEAASPGQLNYPEPDYIAADTDIKIDRLFKGFHANNLLNGALPSLVITMNGAVPDEDVREALKNDTGKTLKGDGGAKIVFLWNDGDQEIKVTPLDVKNNESRYLEIAKYVKGEIVSAHMMPSPLLAGIAANGTIGGSGLELQTAFQLYNFTVIADGQDNLLEGIQHLFDSANMPVQVGIVPLDPFANMATNAAPPTASNNPAA